MAISASELKSIILKSFPGATVEITDLAGDENHYSLSIEHSSFAGHPLIKQHRMVKDALKEILETKLHALTIKTSAG